MRAIAMKCTEEQFNSIKDKLRKYSNITDFNLAPYLVNNLGGNLGHISNVMDMDESNFKREVYETFNAEILLDACGVKVGLIKGKVYEVRDNNGTGWLKAVFVVNFEGSDYFKVGKLISLSLWRQCREINTIKVGDVYKGVWDSKFHAVVVEINDKEVIYTGVDGNGVFKVNMSCPVPVTVELVKQ